MAQCKFKSSEYCTVLEISVHKFMSLSAKGKSKVVNNKGKRTFTVNSLLTNTSIRRTPL